KQIAFVIKEYLGLVLKSAKSGGVDDTVAVTLKLGARRRRLFGKAPSARLGRMHRIRRNVLLGIHAGWLQALKVCSNLSSGAVVIRAAPNGLSRTKRTCPPSFFLSTSISSSQRWVPSAGATTGKPAAATKARMRWLSS